MTTVIRRRKGDNDLRHTGSTTKHLLESGFIFRTMAQRLAAAVTTMEAGLKPGGKPLLATVGVEEREDQNAIIEKFLRYLGEMAKITQESMRPTVRARTVAAARTGKTVLMIRIVALTGLRCVIMAPSTTIVEKTVNEIKEKLPGVPVGAYYGDAKDIVNNGVTVATYQTIGAHAKRGVLPPSIRDAALVFCDEGHETMTEHRQSALDAFDPQAVVVAFTATPDYNKEKTLAVFYPYLIDEMRLMEASQRGLLAPGRMRWRPIDVNASHVRLVTRKGEGDVNYKDYDECELGKVMTQAVVFEACRQMRYEETSNHPYLKDEEQKPLVIKHRDLKTLICVPSTEMAKQLYLWMLKQRPEGSGHIALVLGTTPPDVRRKIIADFKSGVVDTLINVRVLLRGFDEPSLKLLIDLSASLSPVIAEQKFCRPLTKVGDEAGIVAVLYPRGLRPAPILPMAVLGPSFVGDDTRDFFNEERKTRHVKKTVTGEAETGETVDGSVGEEPSKKPKHKKTPNLKALKVNRVMTMRELNVVLRPPSFNPVVCEEVRAVLWSSPDFMRCLLGNRAGRVLPPSRADFRQMLFEHETFVGFGATLLRFCKVNPGARHFSQWIAKIVPEFMILDDEESEPVSTAGEDIVYQEVLMSDLSAFPDPDSVRFEEIVSGGRIRARFASDGSGISDRLSPRQNFVVERRLIGNTFGDIGDEMGLSVERVRQIWRSAIQSMRFDLRVSVEGAVSD